MLEENVILMEDNIIYVYPKVMPKLQNWKDSQTEEKDFK